MKNYEVPEGKKKSKTRGGVKRKRKETNKVRN